MQTSKGVCQPSIPITVQKTIPIYRSTFAPEKSLFSSVTFCQWSLLICTCVLKLKLLWLCVTWLRPIGMEYRRSLLGQRICTLTHGGYTWLGFPNCMPVQLLGVLESKSVQLSRSENCSIIIPSSA